jgi:hypothetical protein
VKKSNFSVKKIRFFYAGQHEKKLIWQRKYVTKYVIPKTNLRAEDFKVER